MNLNVKIIIKEDADKIVRLFEAEEKQFKNERASYEIIKTNNQLLIKMSAKDDSALRAVKNSVNKVLTIYKKTKKISFEDEKNG